MWPTRSAGEDQPGRRLAVCSALLCGALTLAAPAESPAQRRAQLPARWPRAPLLEVARAQVDAQAAFDRFGLTGRGSTLCLVDTGIDHTLMPERTRWIWDPRGRPRGHTLETGRGGAVFDPTATSEGPPDAHGHGTAMASIALGADGLAPAGTLVTTAAWDPDLAGFDDAVVVRAIEFCREVARFDPQVSERTMVILLSLGGHDGRHDGQGAFERAIVEAAGPVPVVVAAGNDGARAVHAAGRLFRGERAQVELHIPPSAIPDAQVGLTLWFEPNDPGASLSLVSPAGEVAPPLSDGARFRLAGARVQVGRRDDQLTVTFRADGGTLPRGSWTVELRGSARFDLWLAGERLGATFLRARLGGRDVVRAETITIPATAPELIAVGATVARERVGELPSEGEPTSVAAYSSRGPTAAGAPKPDLTAPGGWILARLSSDVRLGDPSTLLAGRVDAIVDGRVAVRGSSASAAVVAGALLLALELRPGRGRDARALLVSSTRQPRWTAASGFGALDVGRLLDRLRGVGSGHHEITTPRRLVQVDDEGLWLTARGDGAELSFQVNGRASHAPLISGVAQVFVAPGPLYAGQSLEVTGAIDGAALPALTLEVVPDRRRPIAAAGGGLGGGCGVAVGRDVADGGLGGALLWSLVLYCSRARRSRISLNDRT